MFSPQKEMPLMVQAMPVPSGEPVPSGPRMPGSHGDARQPKKSKHSKSKQTKDPKTPKRTKQTKQTKKRLTKKEPDEAAVQKFLSSPAFNARVTMEVEKQLDKKRRRDRFDKVCNRAFKVMRQFAFLADGDPEVYTDEGDLLLEYMGKMTELQCRRNEMLLKELKEIAEVNAAFSMLKHKRNC